MELQAKDGQARKIEVEKLGRNWQDSNKILHYQSLPYIPEIIKTEPINRHHNNPLVCLFNIKKMQELVAKNYY